MIPHLDLRTDLPKIRAAFDAGELQAQNTTPGQGKPCLYVGPCAIGVCLPVELRSLFDRLEEESVWDILNEKFGVNLTDAHDTTVSDLGSLGLVTWEADQEEDLAKLQTAHDAAVGQAHHLPAFEATLIRLEKKYAA